MSPEFRYYFSEAIEGFYMGGTFNFTSISSTYEGTTIDLVTLEEVPDIKKEQQLLLVREYLPVINGYGADLHLMFMEVLVS